MCLLMFIYVDDDTAVNMPYNNNNNNNNNNKIKATVTTHC